MGFEVAYDPGENIKIVQAVEKYPVIYNVKSYPPIDYKRLSDQAWAKVALELGVSEGYCRGRWTNIKGCFKRYLRNKAQSSNTKTYYLANYLDFMLPFMNVKRRSNVIKRVIHDANIENDNDEMDENNQFEVKLVDSEGEEESFFLSTTSNHSEEMPEDDVEKSADWSFLSSLLPDVQKMDAQQKSKFRNAILNSIDLVLCQEDF